MKLTNEQRKALKPLLRYINDTPDLLSLLYDLDLMPEQADTALDWRRTALLAAWHRERFGKSPDPNA